MHLTKSMFPFLLIIFQRNTYCISKTPSQSWRKFLDCIAAWMKFAASVWLSPSTIVSVVGPCLLAIRTAWCFWDQRPNCFSRIFTVLMTRHLTYGRTKDWAAPSKLHFLFCCMIGLLIIFASLNFSKSLLERGGKNLALDWRKYQLFEGGSLNLSNFRENISLKNSLFYLYFKGAL